MFVSANPSSLIRTNEFAVGAGNVNVDDPKPEVMIYVKFAVKFPIPDVVVTSNTSAITALVSMSVCNSANAALSSVDVKLPEAAVDDRDWET